jgi:SAM-dependent methyltransferase
MFRCGECKLTFVSPLPDADFLQAFYSRFHSANVSAGLYAHFEERVGADFKKKAENVKAMVADPKHANVLDVGCGRGFFIQQCRVSGLSASGIDLSDTAVTYAKDVLNLEVRCGDIFDYPELKESQDVATCWATIEHVPDPIALLKKINSTLKKDGLLFIDTGIGDDWLDRLLPGVNQWYDPPQHLYVFSESALVAALEAAGFSVLRVDRIFERSFLRKVARVLRGFAFAIAARILHAALRVGTGNQGVHFTRYGLGNLISIVAVKKSAAG